MEKQFKKKDLEIQPMTINGEVYGAIFSFAAIKEIEEKTGCNHLDLLKRLLSDSYSMDDLATICCSCLRAGGTEIDENDFINSLTFESYDQIVEQITGIMMGGVPTQEKGEKKPKNVKQ